MTIPRVKLNQVVCLSCWAILSLNLTYNCYCTDPTLVGERNHMLISVFFVQSISVDRREL